MEHVYLVGAVACLVVSWSYILVLKSRIRDCMSYIHNRIDKTNAGRGSEAELGQGSKENPTELRADEGRASAQEGATMDEKPKLIVGSPDSLHPLHYLCSHCLQPFYLSGDQPPKEAVAELLHAFGDHVEQAHGSANSGLTESPEK